MRISHGRLVVIGITSFSLLLLSMIFVGANAFAQVRKVATYHQHLEMQVPLSLKTEHAEIQTELANAMRSGGNTEKAAKNVAKLLHDHFLKEEEYAFPILALLQQVTSGKDIRERDEIIRRSDRLKTELPQMLKEHKAILEGLTTLFNAAQKENKPAQLQFVEKLKLHAQTEEEVLYPAAILVGEYLKLRS